MPFRNDENNRIVDILNKDVEPVGVTEETLLYVYESAANGDSFKSILMTLPAEVDLTEVEDLTMIILGYSEGQETYFSNKEMQGNKIDYNKH